MNTKRKYIDKLGREKTIRKEFRPKSKEGVILNITSIVTGVVMVCAMVSQQILLFLITVCVYFIVNMFLPGGRTDQDQMQGNNPENEGIEYYD